MEPGTRIGRYDVRSRLGSGGMGEVWQAWDPTLERAVAIKVLRHQRSDATGRVLAEARAASALSHANVCTVYEVGESAGQAFIAMELVPGRPISGIIPADGLPPDDVVRYGIQIAAALEHAHEHGVIHRDLKGANVLVTGEGRIKLIDFGIALPPRRGDPDAVTREQPVESGPVGTLSYMAPEVLAGGEATVRSDIWALGVLLYEMATGQQPFGGATQTEVVSAIMKTPPSPLPARVSPGLRGVIQRCLMKEPGQRYRHAAAVEAALEAIQSTAGVAVPDDATGSPGSSRAILWWLAAALVVLAAAGGYLLGLFGRAAPSVLQVANATRVAGASGDESAPTWSPDGSMLAYQAGPPDGGPADIWVVQLAGGRAVNRTGDYAGLDRCPAWSPDGTEIAFFSDRDGPGYYVMSTLGGQARRVADAYLWGCPVWSADGRQLAGLSSSADGLVGIDIHTLQSRESRRIALEMPSALDLAWSPDGRFLALVEAPSADAEITQVLIVRVADGAKVPISERRFAAWSPTWSPDGTLFYVANREGSMDLWQQRIADDGSADGSPLRVTNGVGMRTATLSPDGSRLAYTQGNRVGNMWRVRVLSDRTATWQDAEQLTSDQAYIELINVTPDGERLFFSSDRLGNQDLWSMPASGGEMVRLTTDPSPDWDPEVSASGDLVFYAFRSGNRDVWVMPASGGPARQMTDQPGDDMLPAWSPDGDRIVFLSDRDGSRGLWVMPAAGGDATRVTAGEGLAFNPVWSPDARWIYYLSTADPGSPGVLMRASSSGGRVESLGQHMWPFGWSADGATLFGASVPDFTVWALAPDGRPLRPLTEDGSLGGGRPGEVVLQSFSTDGRYIYFAWRETLGDIWVMDVVGRDAR